MINKEILIPDWREQQDNLESGRFCPVCGRVFKRCFPQHLRISHNIDLIDYALLLHNLDKVPTCKYPECTNTVEFVTWGYNFREFCCNSHRSSVCGLRLSAEGRHPWQSQNLKYDENGQSIMRKKAVASQIANGNHPWQSKNLKYTEDGRSILHINNNRLRVEHKTHNWMYTGDPEHDQAVYNRELELNRKLALEGKQNTWISKPELILCNLLTKLNLNYISQYRVDIDYYWYYIDCYLPKYKLGLECDGMFKWTELSQGIFELDDKYKARKVDIESHTDIKIINIPSNYIVKKFIYNESELNNFIFNFNKYSEFIKV